MFDCECASHFSTKIHLLHMWAYRAKRIIGYSKLSFEPDIRYAPLPPPKANYWSDRTRSSAYSIPVRVRLRDKGCKAKKIHKEWKPYLFARSKGFYSTKEYGIRFAGRRRDRLFEFLAFVFLCVEERREAEAPMIASVVQVQWVARMKNEGLEA